MPIPVYSFTGFLDAGKTKFIQETLEDERFNSGERTLVLICEEGEEEYDLSSYPHKSVYLEPVDQESVTTEELKALEEKHHAKRVILELNGMQMIEPFYRRLPEGWELAQEVMFADANTILSFNRMDPKADKMPLHRLARALNRRIDIVYDYSDGTTEFDDIPDPLPFDLNAPIVTVEDDDYALFYRDITEEPQKYDGKTVRFKGQVARLRSDKPGMFAPGRFVMTCCEADITFMGLPCKYPDCKKLEMRSWVTLTAKVQIKNHPLFKGQGPILTAITVVPAEAPAQEVATF